MGIGRSEGAPLGAGEALLGEVEGSTGPARAAAELAAAGADSAALAVGLGKLVALGAAEVPGAARSAAWTAVSKICWAIALAAASSCWSGDSEADADGVGLLGVEPAAAGEAVAVGVGRAVGVCAAAATDVDRAASAVDSAAVGRLVVSAVGEGAGGLVAATLAVTVGVGSGPVTGDAGSVDECALALGVPVPPGGRVGLATRTLRVGCVVAVDPVTGSLGVGSWLADGVGAAVASARAAPAARRASATRAVILVRICSCWASESAGVDGGATGVSVLLDVVGEAADVPRGGAALDAGRLELGDWVSVIV